MGPLTLLALDLRGAQGAGLCREVSARLNAWCARRVITTVWYRSPLTFIAPWQPPATTSARELHDLLADWWLGPGRLLALTQLGLRSDEGRIVDGAAEMGGEIGIVSLSRLQGKPCQNATGPGDWLDLVGWYSLHEIGHLMGLGHCPIPGCVMRSHSSVNPRINSLQPLCAACVGPWECTISARPCRAGAGSTAG